MATGSGEMASAKHGRSSFPLLLLCPVWLPSSIAAQTLAGKFKATSPMTRPKISDEYQSVTCLACAQMHFVNPNTGKVLGADDE